MAFFNRKKTDQIVLPEIERYYDAEKRERAGLAWLLAIVSIACVALILIGMFFGGRWIYRKLTNTTEKTGVSTTQTVESDIAKGKDKAIGSSSNNYNTTPKTPSTTPATPPAAPPTTPTPAVTAPKPTTPAATPVNGKLADTGPGSVIPYFAVATIFGTFVYRLKLRNNQ